MIVDLCAACNASAIPMFLERQSRWLARIGSRGAVFVVLAYFTLTAAIGSNDGWRRGSLFGASG